MRHITRLSGGAQPAQPTGGSFWGWVGNIFNAASQINLPSQQQSGELYNPFSYQYASYPQTSPQNNINQTVLLIGGGLLIALVATKLLED